MSALPSQAYLKTKVVTASPAELRLMLLDGAIRFAEQTKAGYERNDYERAYEGTTKCQAILTELLCALRPDRSPELCQQLSALYTFLYRSMVEASANKSAAKVEEVLKLLRYERETWVLLMQELAKGNGETSSPSNPIDGGGEHASEQPRLTLRG
ncbi:MAG: flagellar export chaperone FliS [Phycisphaerales bacterium]